MDLKLGKSILTLDESDGTHVPSLTLKDEEGEFSVYLQLDEVRAVAYWLTYEAAKLEAREMLIQNESFSNLKSH